MASKNRATLIADLLTNITANGNNENTGQRVHDLLKDFLESLFNLNDEASLLGFQEFNTGVSYLVGQVVMYEQSIYQAHTANGPGAFNPANYTLLYTRAGASNYDFVPYDNLSTYNQDDRVLYLDKFFICNTNGTQGVPPNDSAPEWTEVSASPGVFGADWIASYYLEGQIVTHNDKLYKLVATTPPSFNSVDIDAEILAGDWVLFHDVGGAGASQTLAQTLALGNDTGANDILIRDDQAALFGNSEAFKLRYNSSSGELEVFNTVWGAVVLRFSANAPILYFNNIETTGGVTHVGGGGEKVQMLPGSITTNYNINFPAKTGTQTFAFLSDLQQFTNLPQLFNEISLSGSIVLSTTPVNILNYNPGINGNYYVEISGGASLTGDTVIELNANINGSPIPVRPQLLIENNQGGGGARTIQLPVQFNTGIIPVTSPAHFISVSANIQVGSVGGTVGQAVIRIFRVI